MMVKQAVIFCGGYGKRLLPITKKIPKPMVLVKGKPFLEHLVNQCVLNGIKKLVFLVGYKSSLIKNYFKNGREFGVRIDYSYNHPNTETLKRLVLAKKLLNEKFLLLYGDNYSDLNLEILKKIYNKNKNFLITVAKKKKGNILLNKKKPLIKKYFFKRSNKSNLVDIGYMIIKKKLILNKIFNEKNYSFNKLISFYSKKNLITYYENQNGYLSISDKKRLNFTRKVFNKKIVLIDRDGVLNLHVPGKRYVTRTSEVKLNENFLSKLSKSFKDYNFLCITNQAGVATKELSYNNLKKINNLIKKNSLKKNIIIKEFFCSLDHFNSNNINRKPNPGLFVKASKKYQFLLNRTFYIGDDIRDIEAAYRAKTFCLYIGKQKLSKKLKNKYKFTLKNLNNVKKKVLN